MKKTDLYWLKMLEVIIPLIQEQIKVLKSNECPKQKLYLLRLNIFGAEIDMQDLSNRFLSKVFWDAPSTKRLPYNKERFFLPYNRIQVVFYLN